MGGYGEIENNRENRPLMQLYIQRVKTLFIYSTNEEKNHAFLKPINLMQQIHIAIMATTSTRPPSPTKTTKTTATIKKNSIGILLLLLQNNDRTLQEKKTTKNKEKQRRNNNQRDTRKFRTGALTSKHKEEGIPVKE